jgi:hypothetical protein
VGVTLAVGVAVMVGDAEVGDVVTVGDVVPVGVSVGDVVAVGVAVGVGVVFGVAAKAWRSRRYSVSRRSRSQDGSAARRAAQLLNGAAGMPSVGTAGP